MEAHAYRTTGKSLVQQGTQKDPHNPRMILYSMINGLFVIMLMFQHVFVGQRLVDVDHAADVLALVGGRVDRLQHLQVSPEPKDAFKHGKLLLSV